MRKTAQVLALTLALGVFFGAGLSSAADEPKREGLFALEGQEGELALVMGNNQITVLSADGQETVFDGPFEDLATLEVPQINGFSGKVVCGLWFKKELPDKDLARQLTELAITRLRDKMIELGVKPEDWAVEIVCTSYLGASPNAQSTYGTGTFDPYKKETAYQGR
ncbi:MAG: hypothetical protein LBS31_09850 [Candidatus Adiutrix sp.]|jgi:hypothetical protein|nr:hypothetical protein [Candidatus Adiutrix sp.]